MMSVVGTVSIISSSIYQNYVSFSRFLSQGLITKRRLSCLIWVIVLAPPHLHRPKFLVLLSTTKPTMSSSQT